MTIRVESTVASASLPVTCLDLICLYLTMVTVSVPAQQARVLTGDKGSTRLGI